MVAICGGMWMESAMMVNMASQLLLLSVAFSHPIIYGQIVKNLQIRTIIVA
jgi:hypothetical protein